MKRIILVVAIAASVSASARTARIDYADAQSWTSVE